MPLYEDLVRRAVAAQQRAADLSVDARRIGNLAQLLRDAAAGRVLIRRCAWCGRFDVGGEWLYLEAIGRRQHQIAASIRERATHGICEDCLRRTQRAAKARQRRHGGPQ